jgi:hypothetical protein
MVTSRLAGLHRAALAAAPLTLFAIVSPPAAHALDNGPLDARVGWVSECLGIKNADLSAGTPVTFILYDPERPDLQDQRILSKRVQGAILGRANSAEHCQPIADITGRANEEAGYVFYRVAIEGVERMPPSYDFGFGILGLRAEDERPIDLDGGGEPDSFTVCDGIHGVNYKVWHAAPREGEPLWHAYYNLGYEIEGPSECASEP